MTAVEIEQERSAGMARLGAVETGQLPHEPGVEGTGDNLSGVRSLQSIGELFDQRGQLACGVVR